MKQSTQRRKQPKQLRAIQTSQHLHVAARQHTGHIIHKRHTSYPVLLMLLLCVGVFLVSWTRFVNADTFIYPGPQSDTVAVHASVPGPAPTIAATIDYPNDNDTFHSTPVTVTGSCPDETYVSISRNGFPSGVGLCGDNNTYSVPIDLFNGTDALVAQVYSMTDIPGPPSDTTTITYIAPSPPPTQTGSGNSSSGSTSMSSTTPIIKSTPSHPYNPLTSNVAGEPLTLKTNFTLLGYYVGQTASWHVTVEGGSGPYAVDVEWGDGTHQLYSRASAGEFTISHVYKKAGGYRGNYPVKISATDTASGSSFLQLVAIINQHPKTVTDGSSGGGFTIFPNSDQLGRLVKYIWPSYGVVLLMLASFWLGERRELRHVQPLLKKKPVRRHA